MADTRLVQLLIALFPSDVRAMRALVVNAVGREILPHVSWDASAHNVALSVERWIANGRISEESVSRLVDMCAIEARSIIEPIERALRA